MKPPLQTPVSNNNQAWTRWFNNPFSFTTLARQSILMSSAAVATWTLISPAGNGLVGYIPNEAKMLQCSIQIALTAGSYKQVWFDLAPLNTGYGKQSFQLFGNTITMTLPANIPLLGKPEHALYYRIGNQDPSVTTPGDPGGSVYLYITGYWS